MYKEIPPQQPTSDKIAALVQSQRGFLLDLISEHKAEVESKLQSRQRKFQSKQIEKQYEVNLGFKELVDKIQVKLRCGDLRQAEETLEKLSQDIEQHGEDLVIADTSQFGWLAVAKIRASAELPGTCYWTIQQEDDTGRGALHHRQAAQSRDLLTLQKGAAFL
jgi:hypothetical protein